MVYAIMWPLQCENFWNMPPGIGIFAFLIKDFSRFLDPGSVSRWLFILKVTIFLHVVSFRRPRGSGKWPTFWVVFRKGPINHCSLPITSIEKYFIVDLLLLFLLFGIFYIMTQSNFLRRLNSLFYSNSHDFLQFAN